MVTALCVLHLVILKSQHAQQSIFNQSVLWKNIHMHQSIQLISVTDTLHCFPEQPVCATTQDIRAHVVFFNAFIHQVNFCSTSPMQ